VSKVKEIEVWMSEIDLQELKDKGVAIIRTEKNIMAHHSFKAKLSYPEKAVEITESEFDEAWNEALELRGMCKAFLPELKQKLFGGDK
jgi:hypothetical protein